MGLFNIYPLVNIRRNHGLEHATIHVLSEKNPRLSIVGRSDLGGFTLYGEVETDQVIYAADEALNRLRAGQAELAIHPRCGTILATTGILTGLVESHFMAGVSGGRKSICPGLVDESSTQILHSGPILASPHARDMVLKGNPVHEEATRVAKMAGCDMIINVTLDSDFKLTGVFAGDLEQTLLQAYEKIKTYVTIPVTETYDLVLSHAGYVGVNHYQAAKGAILCAPIIENNGICLLAAHHTDKDPIGGQNYKRMIRLLGEVGAETFIRKIIDPSWSFVPEQWEAQMWAKLFKKIPPENFLYCTLEISEETFFWLPERDARTIAPEAANLRELTQKTFDWALEKKKEQLDHSPKIAVLTDGPYGIPFFTSF